MGRGEELWVLLLLSEKCAHVELCKVKLACQADSIRWLDLGHETYQCITPLGQYVSLFGEEYPP